MKVGTDILWLSENDVASLLSMKETLPLVETAFRLHGEGEAQLPSKIYLTFEPFDGDLRAMPAYLKGTVSAAGVKIINSNPSNPAKGLPAVTGILVYTDPQTGLPLGVFGAGTLTAYRTGAAGGIAAKYLAREASDVVGLVGCGKQAQTQLEALLPFFPIKKVFVWGKTKEESDLFVTLNEKLKMELVSTTDLAAVCRAADILVTTTPSKTPVVKAAWVRPGTHINAIGADAPGKQELETALLTSARVVVDDWHQASHAGEVNVAVSTGQLKENDIAGQLGEIVIGKKTGRQKETDITVFDSTGLAIQDVAVAKFLYEKAVKLKKGQVLKLYG